MLRLFNILLIVCYQSNANKQSDAHNRRFKLEGDRQARTHTRTHRFAGTHGVCVMRKSKSLIWSHRTIRRTWQESDMRLLSHANSICMPEFVYRLCHTLKMVAQSAFEPAERTAWARHDRRRMQTGCRQALGCRLQVDNHL